LSGVPAGFADNIDNDTTYTAGNGLSLSNGQFEAQFAGSGIATTIARVDHNHGGQNWIGGSDYGLRIQNNSSAAFVSGLIGVVTQASNSAGVQGRHENVTGDGRGVFGVSQSNSGIGTSGYASSITGATAGIFGSAESPNGIGVSGYAASIDGATVGVFGGSESITGTGVVGIAYSVTGENAGVYGSTNSPFGWAGYFDGDVNVVGTLFKSAGSFRIDHPLDPENKYLSHSFVESPDMMNIYNGNVTLDANGEAWVVLPSYFEALNKDFRYQLTPIGGPGPNLFVAEPVSSNQFKIAGGTSGLIVSWQVTGIRQDAYALANPIIVEQDKSSGEPSIFTSMNATESPVEQRHYEQQLQSEMSRLQATPSNSSESNTNSWENR
jgi:hypothetical protein